NCVRRHRSRRGDVRHGFTNVTLTRTAIPSRILHVVYCTRDLALLPLLLPSKGSIKKRVVP
ncbi:hypothetical protein HPB47_002369, partial [Ixodes persulcatus]